MKKEEIANIIQNLSEEELEYALQNAKQQAEVIDKGLALTESRTKLLITFLVAAIILCIIGFNSCENALYFRLFCGLIIFSYIIEVLIIVHCYFLNGVESDTLNSVAVLEKLYKYKTEYNPEKTMFYVKRNRLLTILQKSIPPLEELRNKRVKTFNCCLLSTFSLPIWFVVVIFIGYLLI